MSNHSIKLATRYFSSVELGLKTAELRNNDRDFKVGDTLTLLEIDLDGKYTGKSILAVVRDVANVDFLLPNYVLLSIKVL